MYRAPHANFAGKSGLGARGDVIFTILTGQQEKFLNRSISLVLPIQW